MASRDEKKKQRRQKRLQKREQYQRQTVDPNPKLAQLRELERTLHTPAPGSFPGAQDPSLNRPDLVKFELAGQVVDHEPGRSKFRSMTDAARKGLLKDAPDLVDHWVMEEFIWHGVPGDPWQPVEAFLSGAGARFPPAAAEQLRLWKAAEIGLYEIGAVRDDTVTLQAWDPIQKTPSGRPLRAISLNLGGVNAYRKAEGTVTLTYLAPWVPADNLYCAMGYGTTLPKRAVDFLVPYLGLRHPEVVCRPLPWELNRPAADEHMRQWRQREWHGWLEERLRLPFWAMVATPPKGEFYLRQVTQLLPSTPLEAQQTGVYLLVPTPGVILSVGCTMVTPIDVTSPSALALAEYQAYRRRVGPPPGTRGTPPFVEVR